MDLMGRWLHFRGNMIKPGNIVLTWEMSIAGFPEQLWNASELSEFPAKRCRWRDCFFELFSKIHTWFYRPWMSMTVDDSWSMFGWFKVDWWYNDGRMMSISDLCTTYSHLVPHSETKKLQNQVYGLIPTAWWPPVISWFVMDITVYKPL